MKIFFAFACLMVLGVLSNVSAQSARFGIISNSEGRDVLRLNFPGEPGVEYRVFETIVRARSLEECMDVKTITGGTEVSGDRIRIEYNEQTGEYESGIFVEREYKPNCRVISVRSSINSHDLNVWRSNYGLSGASSARVGFGDGSVRFVRYSVNPTVWY